VGREEHRRSLASVVDPRIGKGDSLCLALASENGSFKSPRFWGLPLPISYAVPVESKPLCLALASEKGSFFYGGWLKRPEAEGKGEIDALGLSLPAGDDGGEAGATSPKTNQLWELIRHAGRRERASELFNGEAGRERACRGLLAR
jgi:hypothetical protein